MTYLLFGVCRGDSGDLSRGEPWRGDLGENADENAGENADGEEICMQTSGVDLSGTGDLEREYLAWGDLSLDFPLDLPPDPDRYVAWL